MNDLISRQAAIEAVLDRIDVEKHGRNAKPEEIQWTLEKLPSAQPFVIHCTDCEDWYKRQSVWNVAISELPSAQPEKRTIKRTETHSCDLISRAMLLEYIHNEPVGKMLCDKYNLDGVIKQFPSAQPDVPDTNVGDMIYRQAAVDAIDALHDKPNAWLDYAVDAVMALPSAQPERKCVNCGRTVNNGGWYEDGRTRCPIEEHYALPKDGYCHLWEKRKDWEDDYVKRAEEGEK